MSDKRKPILSDEAITPKRAIDTVEGLLVREAMVKSGQNVRDFYEGLIDEGILITKEEHLRLVKEAEDRASFRWTEA